ncbi:TetR/AcrR family transcriptional regulator C-terminal domain-containing protein [Kitasatospora sp. GP82]|uniref:TetR/AcrR family transcriptional regulator n=1 Tax=Kitasatospora sp. GP82 TaxID=3035089 RepID=UPI0024733B0D|nr:TetR/AcrR family transcriptional regulator C-terminal domain-containing protein [Kitasatospora sp. GP82]MDH6127324.1 AcrR family transcriptional regulator [Kitasatospora sp. GP82]
MADKFRDPAVSIWVKQPKTRKRGVAPSALSRDRIVRATVGLLDADGVHAFSMRKLAAELDVTPMSVYWYVDNKDELLELALDDVLGQMRIPPLEDHGDWRRHLHALAHEYRHCFQEHPWAAQLAGQFLALGPNSLLFSTSAISAITRSGLPADQAGAALGLLFEYAYGFALLESQWLLRVRASGLSEEEFYSVVYGIVEQADVRFVEQAELVGNGGTNSAAARDRRFAQGLDFALAGIDARIAGARTSGASTEAH